MNEPLELHLTVARQRRSAEPAPLRIHSSPASVELLGLVSIVKSRSFKIAWCRGLMC